MLKLQKVLVLIVFVSIFFIGNAYAACTGSSPTWTATPDYASVSSCLSSASSGDTINVLAGSMTWGSRLSITKAVKIIGAGTSRTIINNSYAPSLSGGSLDPAKHLISIVPASPETNPEIRISGFTFNFGTTSYGIYYGNSSTTYDCTNVRLDHLNISASSYVLQRYGLAHGVMDHCSIKGKMDGGGSATLWTTNGYEYGTASNFYIEDSTWEAFTNTTEIYQAGNGAFRYAFRYNTITIPTGVQISPLFDQHGNQYGAQAGCFGAELYGNKISTNGNNWRTLFYDQRGGKSLVYNNTITWTTGGGVSTRIREEHLDSDGSGLAINAINGQPQHISDTYYWGNNANGVALVPSLSDELGIGIPKENVHVWLEKTSFNGTSGVGIGLRSTRPTTCITGVGYWASDENKLYRCTTSGAWALYYTPYPYPHPLTTGQVTTTTPITPTAPAAPQNLRIIN